MALASMNAVVKAQVYANQHLEELATAIKASGVSEAEFKTGSFIVTAASSAKPVVLHQNEIGQIDNIGFKIVDDVLRTGQNGIVLQFLERYILEILMNENDEQIALDLKMNNVKFHSDEYTGTTRQVLRKFVQHSSAKNSIFVQHSSVTYTVNFREENTSILTATFPARYELLLGTSKLESEERFYGNLMKFCTNYKAPEMGVTSADLTQTATNYTAHDGYYLIENLKSNSYYFLQGEEVIPVYTDDNRLHSIYNIFNCDKDFGLTAKVTQSMYRGKMNFDIPIIQMIQFIKSEGCSIYTGIEKITRESITGVVIAVNPALGYHHQLQFTVPTKAVANPTAYNIEIMMHSYIPIHNLNISKFAF